MVYPDDPYEVLQVSRNAEPEVIEAAFRRLARKYHPDVDTDPASTARMQKINWAYEILRDPVRRARHDRTARSGRTSRPWTETHPPSSEARGRRGSTSTKGNHTSSRTDDDDANTDARAGGEPPITRSVLYGALGLAGYYALAIIFLPVGIGSSPVVAWILIAGAFVASTLLAVAASAGWSSKKITIWRILLMLVLSSLPITAWIPCYLAGKAVARRTTPESVTQGSRFPLIAYGIGATLLAIFAFGNFPVPQDGTPTSVQSTIQYVEYRDSETGVRFDQPAFFEPHSHTSRERTDLGTVFSVTVISAESRSPSALLMMRILEDPTRDEMFPELYPPDDQALRLLMMGDLADFQFSEDELPERDLMSAYEDAEIIEIDGFRGAEYALRPRATAIGDSIVRGALIVTDKQDVSLMFIASTEEAVSGSLSEAQVEEVWDRLKRSIEFGS